MKTCAILIGAVVLLLTTAVIAQPNTPASAPASQPIATAPTTTTPAPAASTAEPKDVAEQVGIIVKLFKDKSWRPAIAAIITLLIFLWRRFLGKLLIDKIPDKHLGWFTALLGLLAAIPAALTAGEFIWYKFIVDALLISGPAVLFWTTLGKHLLPKVFGAIPEKTSK